MKLHRSSGSLKRGRPVLLLVGCCALLLAAAQARGQEEKLKDAGVELKLSAYESKVCLRSALTLMLEVTNTGEEELKFYKPSLWSQFSYKVLGSGIGGHSIACGAYDDSKENWVVLEPGAQYRDTLAYRLDWNEFFDSPGRYQISTGFSYQVSQGKYGRMVNSNQVEFEIQDCAAK